MNDKNLTEAYIQEKEKRDTINLNIRISDDKNFKKEPYILVIKSFKENCARLTLYPIKISNLIKISLSGININNDAIIELARLFQDFEIIHTSGLLLKGNEFYYECYLNFSISDTKIKVLKTSLNKIKKIFKVIKIEEIGLR